MNFLFEITKDDYNKVIINDGFVETALFGAKMLLIGMVTVFSVLFLIFACLTLFKVFFHDLPSKKRPKAVVKKEVVEEAPKFVEKTNNDEIIAVIAAAIAMAESEAPGTKFRVVSFRRQ